MRYIKRCDKETEIYVDSNLNANVSGEILLKQLYDLGFRNLFIETGHNSSLYKNINRH